MGWGEPACRSCSPHLPGHTLQVVATFSFATCMDRRAVCLGEEEDLPRSDGAEVQSLWLGSPRLAPLTNVLKPPISTYQRSTTLPW